MYIVKGVERGKCGFDKTEENYTESLCFDKIVDVDNLQSLLFGEQLSEIPLN